MFPKFTFGSFRGFVNGFYGLFSRLYGFYGDLCRFEHLLPVVAVGFGAALWREVVVSCGETRGARWCLRGSLLGVLKRGRFPGADLPMRLKDGAFGRGREGFVEQVDDGGGETKAVDDFADEGGANGVLGGEGGGDAPLAAEEEVDGRVVGKEAFGRAGEGLAVDGLHELAEAGGGEETAELGVAAGASVGEVAADGEELVSLGHVDPGGDGDLGGVDVEVEAAAGGFFEAGASPPGGGVRLVRALVAGEADITVDAHERFLRGADVLGGEGEYGFVDLGDDGEHGLLELALEDVAAGFEPEAVVVAFEAAKEAEGGGGEVGRHEGMVPGGGGACRGERLIPAAFAPEGAPWVVPGG